MANACTSIIARTPANFEGGIDPLPILHQAQNEEEAGQEAGKRTAAGRWDPGSAAQTPVKFSYFIQEILEDSTFIASNERLNEAAIANCIARLKKYRDEQEVRVKSALLYDMETLPPDQQRDAMNQYLEKMRALRGSPPREGSRLKSSASQNKTIVSRRIIRRGAKMTAGVLARRRVSEWELPALP